MTGSSSPVLPLRPMTVGEAYDAAAGLLRIRWRSLLPLAFVLAASEQVIMTILRSATIQDVRPQYLGDLYGDGFGLWVWIVVGLTIEIGIITVMSAPAAKATATIASGGDLETLPRTGLTGRQWRRVADVVPLMIVVGAIGAAALFLPWLAVLSVLGLLMPIRVVDGLSRGASLMRTFRMVKRSGGRTVGTLLLAYVSWLMIRLVVTCGFAWLQFSGLVSWTTALSDHYLIALGIVYTLVNTAAYGILGCVAAVVHVEARMRHEGLDIAVDRMRALGKPVVLTAPEAP